MKKAVQAWYQGKHYENKPEDPFVFIGFYKKHWTSKLAHALVKFWKKEYKWIIGTVIALVSLYVAYLKLIKS